MRISLLFACLCVIASFAGAAPSEIAVSEQTAPDVNQFGIQSKQALTLDDATVTTLVEASGNLVKRPLAPLQRDILAQLLTAPELIQNSNVPSDWMAQRLRLLRHIGRPDEAWRLYTEIPSLLMTEAVAREGLNTAWSLAKTEEACGLVSDSIEKFGNSYWTQQQLICALLKENQPQVEFSLQLLEETAPNELSPVLKAIAERSATLPALSEKDSNVLAALGIYLRQSATNQSTIVTIPPNFIDQMPLSVLPPDLLGWAGYNPIIPLSKRCDAAEAAYQQARIDAAGLRQVYQEVLRTRADSPSTPPYCTRANVLASIGSAVYPQDRTYALYSAYNMLREFYTDAQTRALLIEEIREFTGRLPDRTAPNFLMLQAALAHIEAKDRQSAENIGDQLAALNTMQGRVAAFAVRQSIAFSFTSSYDTAAPDIDDIPMPNSDDKAETVWHRTRVADVLEALNYPLPPTVRSNQFNAPQPALRPINPELLSRFQQAKLDGNKGAALLNAALLLNSATLDVQGGTVIGQIIAMLNSYGMSKEAYILSTDALLTPAH